MMEKTLAEGNCVSQAQQLERRGGPKSWTFVYARETHTVRVGRPVPPAWFFYCGDWALISDMLHLLTEQRPKLRPSLAATVNLDGLALACRLVKLVRRNRKLIQDEGWHPIFLTMAVAACQELCPDTLRQILAGLLEPQLRVSPTICDDSVIRGVIKDGIVPVLVKQFLQSKNLPFEGTPKDNEGQP